MTEVQTSVSGLIEFAFQSTEHTIKKINLYGIVEVYKHKEEE